jgi:hypothetical protein
MKIIFTAIIFIVLISAPYNSLSTALTKAAPPAAPSTPDLDAADDSGISDTDNITNVTTNLTFSGTAEAGSTVRLYSGGTAGTLLGTTTASVGGTWTINVTGPLAASGYSISATAENVDGVSPESGILTLTIKTSSSTVSNVTSNKADGSYTVGEVIDVRVVFNENVHVTGTPQITLETGATDRVVDYSSGSASTTLIFNYTVQAGDLSADLDYVAINSLALNGGTIRDVAGNNATLTLAAPGAAGSLAANKALVIDAKPPVVTNVSSNKANGSYKAGEVIDIRITFDETVNVTGTPQITLETGTTDRVVDYSSGTGSNTLVFNYTVQAGDQSNDLDYTTTGALALNGGTIRDALLNNATLTLPTPGAAGSLGANKNIIIDTQAPTVSSVTSNKTNGSYKAGEVIDIRVVFTETVVVTGTPQITLETGTTDQVVNYTSGSGSNTLVFNYTVQTGDVSGDLDYVASNSLALNGGTIRDAATNDATLTLPAPGATNSLGDNKNIVIDTQAPTVTSVTSNKANGTYKAGEVIDIRVVFSETVNVTGTPQITLETGVTDRVVNYSSGSGSNTLVFNYTVQSGDVSADLDYVATNALALNGGTIRDAATNDATLTLPAPGGANSLGSNKNIVIDTQAPTLTIVRQTATDGAGATNATSVVFRVTFSENVLNVDLTDFIANPGNTATGNPSAISTITPSTVFDITFNPVSGDYDVLNMDVSGSNDIADAAGNTIVLPGGITSEQEYIIDTTKPTLAPDEMALNLNGTNPEIITFTLSEELTLSEGASVTGFITSTGTIATAIYTGKGSTNTITLTSSANNQWTTSTTVSYAAGNVADRAGNTLNAIVNKPVVENVVNLGPGAVFFTSVKETSSSANGSAFSFVLLRDITSGTQIKFTDYGWKNTNAFRTDADEKVITWTANSDLFAGTHVLFTGDNSGDYAVNIGTVNSGSGEFLLNDNGDQIFAFQGTTASPTFLAGIYFAKSGGWDSNSTSDQTSAAPSTLNLTGDPIHGTVNLAFDLGDFDNGAYNHGTAGLTTGTSVANLVSKLRTLTNWTRNNTYGSVTLPPTNLAQYTLPPDPNPPFTPAAGSSITLTLPNLTIPFTSNNLSAGVSTGSDIVLRKHSDGSLIPGGVWNVGTTAVSISGTTATVNTGALALTHGEVYRVEVANRVFVNTDLNGNEAITGATWTFTADGIAPTVTSINRKTPATALTNATSLTFAVTFSENVTGVDINDFALATTGGVVGSINSVSASSGTTIDVTVTGVTGNGTIGLNLAAAPTINDNAGNALTGPFTGQTYTIDQILPTVTSIVRKTPSNALTNATSLVYTVTFSEAIAPASFTDADLTKTLSGVTVGTATIATTGNPAVFDVTLPSVSGNGTVRIDILAAAVILDLAGNDINTSFTTGDVYTIDQILPTVSSIVRKSPSNPTNASAVTFTVTFSEAIDNTTVNAADFTLTTSGITTGGVTGISQTSANIFDITISSITGTGTLRLDLLPAATILDLAGNDYNATFNTGQVFDIDQSPPTLEFINVNPSFINAWSASVNGTTPSLHSNQIEFIVRFSETVSGVSFSNFSTTIGASNPGFPSVSAIANTVKPVDDVAETDLAPGTPSRKWKVVYNYLSGSGTFQLNFTSTINIIDNASNGVSATLPINGQSYTVALPQPSTQVTSVLATPGANSINVTWVDALTATHYLVFLTTALTPSPAIADGTYVNDDSDFTDGKVMLNVAQGVQSASFAGLTAGSSYNVYIYAYTLSPNTIISGNRTSIDFNLTNPAIVSRASDIIRETTFSYPTNIPYDIANNQVADITTGTGVAMERFTLRDGGSAANDPDNLPTRLSSVTLKVTNWQYLRRIALYEVGAGPGFASNIELSDLSVAGNITNIVGNTGDITFSGLNFIAPDNQTNNFIVKASFNASNVLDNAVISFQVTNVNALTTGSLFSTSTPAGIQSSLSGDQNKIEVTATQLHFTTPAASTTVSLSTPFTVVVQARDTNLNVDLDFEGVPSAVTSLTNASSATMFSTPPVVGTQFTDGVLNFPNDFQFTTGNNNDNVTLSIGAGGLVNAPGFTPTLTLQASLESAIVADPTFNFITNIPYETFVEETDLTDANSFLLARALLVDGSRTNFNYTSTFGSGTLTTNTDLDGQPNTDQDGAATTLNSLTLRVTNPANIRRIALFTNNGVQIGNEISVDELKTVTSKDFVFSGSPLLVAADNTEAEIRVRVSFWNDADHITDNNLIQVSIASATLAAGSKFFNDPPYIAGVNGGLTAPTIFNFIEVTATSLDFILQPSAYAGILEPIDGSPGTSPGGSTGIVHARDKFAVVDLDFNFAASVTAPANPINYPANFTAGVLNLTGMRYQNGGNGTLTVVANSLNSNNEPWATSARCDNVEVIHITASLPQNPNNGVVTTQSLKGGTSNVVIFGFDIYPTYSTADEPELKEFSIIFDQNYKTATSVIFKNFKVYESLVGTFVGSTNVTTITGTTVAETQSPALIAASAPATFKDMVTVTFPVGNYRSLKNRGQGNPITYFLVADIDATANLATPKITPQLLDGGFSSANNNSISTTIGSSMANVKGTTFGFASTKPPSLIASNPSNGALNVSASQDKVELFFDVGVWSHDKYILLWDRYSNTLVDTLKLTGTNGFYPGPVTDSRATPPIPLTFTIPDPSKLKADSVYYVTIAKGTFDPNTKKGTGISDDGFNLYGGLSFNGGLYFKIASAKPPRMVSTDPNKYYASATGANINASFDQKEGKAFFMVVNQGGPAPTNAQIKGTDLTYAGVVQARGQMIIDQVSPNLNFGSFNIAPSGVPRTFDVWICAENGAPTPVPTTAPYGKFNSDADSSNDFVPGAAGPTFTITIPANSTSTYLSKPVYQICANSQVILADPIILEEGSARTQFSGTSVTAGNFVNDTFYAITSLGTTNFMLIGASSNTVGTIFRATGAGSGTGTATPVQNFNLLLPVGFSFDVTHTPTISVSGGADFLGNTTQYQYVNSTILRVGFTNFGSASQDKITITNLKVIANAPDLAGTITRFAGNAFPNTSSFQDGTILAGIASSSATPLSFSNSFTVANNFDDPPISITNAVTAIPDNYVDPDVNLSAGSVRLLPNVPKGDYGPSSFSGSGITNDILTLNAVTLNTAFDITMTHTDMNGCISNRIEQYEVYDHRQAIPALVDATYGTKDYITNPNYLNNQPPPPFSNTADSIGRNFKAGYNMIELFANIPARATAFDTLNVANNRNTSQIMFGPAWQNLVKKIPIKKDSSDFNVTLGEYYRSYYWYYGVLMPLDPSLDPYKYFDAFTPERRKFYRGGSLGIVEFTGKFRSTADFTVVIPIRQEIEVFIPAIPVIEIASEAISGYDPTDPLKPDPKNWPQGTPIFCQSGNQFTITGYPSATPGVSAGFFDIVDAANPLDTLYSSKTPAKRYGGFTDNLNGTAVLIPGQLRNSAGQVGNAYKDIRIVYTYKDNASPIAGSGDLVIRITPNPVANFTTSKLCEDIDIQFTDTSTLSPGSGATITEAFWNFADSKAAARENADTVRYPSTRIPVHVYPDAGNYPGVSLRVVTNFGCSSTPALKTLGIGGTPNVQFSFIGVSTADPIIYTSASTVTSPNTVPDGISLQEWVFGDGNSGSGATVSNTFNTPGHYSTKLTVTTQKGCIDSLRREVVILPRVVVTDASVYYQDFEAGNANWQFLPSNATWQWTTANKPVIKNDALLNGQKVWITNNTGQYDQESYLFTASFDITDLDRPMVSFHSFVQMDNGDGVVMEYSTDSLNVSDPAKVWLRLGTNASGVKWYNEQGLPSRPGDQLATKSSPPAGDYGWAGLLLPNLQSNIPPSWFEAKHSLTDNLSGTVPGIPAGKKGRVVFRFALASVSTRTTDGFALDNFRLGNRTRTVLIEHFTNKGTNNTNEKPESDFLKSFVGSVGTEIIKVNYHVGFPGVDPFNQLNPADPSGRALYYSVNKTPFTFLDGSNYNNNYIPSRLFSGWAEEQYSQQSLQLAGADITITPTLNAGTYSVSVDVTARQLLPASAVLHVAFLEETITTTNGIATGESTFKYVLKKMLPSAAGTRFNQPLTVNSSRTFGPFTWTPDAAKLFAPTNDLVVVAFIQDEGTKEIYQSELVSSLADPPVVTGIKDLLPDQISIYPNPVEKEMKIELPAIVQTDVDILMIDQVGRVQNGGKISSGTHSATVDMESFAEGIYILQLGSDQTGIVRRKIMVVRKN